MGNEVGPARASAAQHIPDSGLSLEELLLQLSKFGKPRVSHTGDGWYAALEMYVGREGVDFKIASDFGAPSPLRAVEQCAQRMKKALAALA